MDTQESQEGDVGGFTSALVLVENTDARLRQVFLAMNHM